MGEGARPGQGEAGFEPGEALGQLVDAFLVDLVCPGGLVEAFAGLAQLEVKFARPFLQPLEGLAERLPLLRGEAFDHGGHWTAGSLEAAWPVGHGPVGGRLGGGDEGRGADEGDAGGQVEEGLEFHR